MRVKQNSSGLHVHAIPGSHVVVFGFDWPEERADELQGFALHRTDHRTGRAQWVEAQKRYQSTDPGTATGERVSTRQHPVQAFLWADYTVNPGQRYTYRVVALGGTPAALSELADVTLDVDTIAKTNSGHRVHFNRGAIAAQEYARRFKNKAPEDVPNHAAFDWLSRGLLESLLAFIGDARAGDALHVAIYEARYARVLTALAEARQRGVAVDIVYDAKENGRGDEEPFPRNDNIDMLGGAGLLAGAFARTSNPSYISHNKFIVLSRAGSPAAVWTGSTNWSENGFFGQLNTGHEIWQPAVAAAFLDYWRLLADDPAATQLREEIADANPLPATWDDTPPGNCASVFSPRASREALDRYIGGIADADAVFVTLAFSIDDALGAALQEESPGLRYVLMDGIKGTKAQVAALTQTVRDIRATEAARVAVGAYLRGNALDQFLLERRNPMASHVQFVHTKFMLIDPLGATPVVITGSANFSDASSKKNDENMVVIAGDDEVADIYLGEFMRSYTHYAFRDAVASTQGQPFVPKPLNEDRTWAGDYYGEGFRSRQRRYFAHAGE
ncbi:hypothetical protein GJ700_27810 [Duganella sp. FT92W]|uniref:phospholipase D n=1 Tax=Pseudoduganella rivuli TaxID=2666085 RepID=A0A7X2IT75_9BURK|nr:phospholipase D-like domain-containing protein [Pseudoduganella rivuli]MRV75530.1 hypothetical protein [Pseudoduganella rivuli]